jgi:MFS family permease
VLEELDSRIPTNFYWYLAVLACVGGFLFGYDTANIGSALDFIPYHLSSFWTGYLVAGASLGAGVGALLAGPLTDRFGRKTLLITDAAIYAIGALLSAFTVNAFMLLSSRTLIGLAIGADSAIATAYIAEFAPRNRRGQLSIIQQWMITVGSWRPISWPWSSWWGCRITLAASTGGSFSASARFRRYWPSRCGPRCPSPPGGSCCMAATPTPGRRSANSGWRPPKRRSAWPRSNSGARWNNSGGRRSGRRA